MTVARISLIKACATDAAAAMIAMITRATMTHYDHRHHYRHHYRHHDRHHDRHHYRCLP